MSCSEDNMMDKELQIALTEAKDVLQNLPKEERKKIPIQLRRFMVEHYDKAHKTDFKNLSRKTYALLAVINRKYLAENKEELERKYREDLKNKKM